MYNYTNRITEVMAMRGVNPPPRTRDTDTEIKLKKKTK